MRETVLNRYLAKLGPKLEMAGLPADRARALPRRQIVFAAAGLAIVLLPTGLPVTIAPAFALAGFFQPLSSLNTAVRKRQRALLLALPYYIDLLTLALEAGIDFIAAVEEVVRHDRPHPLREELRIALGSIRMGSTRSEAFEQLARRTGVEALGTWASAVRQSEELGSSLGNVLRLQSESLRKEIFRKAEEQAQKAPVKILLPLIGLIFPVVFLLLFAPIAIRLFIFPS